MGLTKHGDLLDVTRREDKEAMVAQCSGQLGGGNHAGMNVTQYYTK